MAGYIDELVKFGEEASRIRAQIISDALEIEERNLMDGNFFAASGLSGVTSYENALTYSASSRKGLVVWNPRPGFNEGKYRVDNGLVAHPVNILLDAAAKLPNISTHDCQIIDSLPETQVSMRTAIHLHLHYSDLAPEFAERFSRVIPKADLFVTVTSERARREVDYEFRDYPGQVIVQASGNRGRDVAPMLDVLRQHHQDYDVFGHFHGKKSLFAGGNTGNAWRSFLLETLAGTTESVARLMGLFERDPALGLVFAEDRLNAGWTENKDIAADLARQLGLKVELDSYPIYPIGTMFWVRPAALMPLISSSLTTEDFPPEPLADDGTSLHALERIIPTIVRSEGFSWCTVRRNGVNRRF